MRCFQIVLRIQPCLFRLVFPSRVACWHASILHTFGFRTGQSARLCCVSNSQETRLCSEIRYERTLLPGYLFLVRREWFQSRQI
jgi:hypothetical protein